MRWHVYLGGRTRVIDSCYWAPPIVAITVILWYFLIWDRGPPFKYIGGTIIPQTAAEGSTVTRSRLTVWYRSDCQIKVTGHLIDSAGNRLHTDSFFVPERPMVDWVEESKADHPHRFTKELLVRMPVDADGKKHYGEICYFSLDHAWCNVFQRMWPFSNWPIRIDGPMMCFKVTPPG
jgi:hypothetical protein